MSAVVLGLAGSLGVLGDPQGDPYSRRWSVLGGLGFGFFFPDGIHQASSAVCSLSYQGWAGC